MKTFKKLAVAVVAFGAVTGLTAGFLALAVCCPVVASVASVPVVIAAIAVVNAG